MSTTVLDSLVSSTAARKKNDAFALSGAEKPSTKATALPDDSKKDKSFAAHVDSYNEETSDTAPLKQTRPTPLPSGKPQVQQQNPDLEDIITSAIMVDADAEYKEDTNAETELLAIAVIDPDQSALAPTPEAEEPAVIIDIDLSTAAPAPEVEAAPQDGTTQPVAPDAEADTQGPAPLDTIKSDALAAAAVPQPATAAAPLSTENTAPADDLLSAAKPAPVVPLASGTEKPVVTVPAAPVDPALPQAAQSAEPTGAIPLSDDLVGLNGEEIADPEQAALLKQAAAEGKQAKTTPALVADPTASGAGAKETTASTQNRAALNPATLGAENTQATQNNNAGTGENSSNNSNASPQQSKFVEMLGNKAATQSAAATNDNSFANTVNDASSTTADISKSADTPDLPQQQLLAQQNSNPVNRTFPQPILSQVPAAVVQLGVEIAARHRKGTSQFDIRLDPAELGKVDVRIEIDRHGRIKSHLFVEKAETLELLKADLRGLERALEQAGLRTDGNSLSLNLRDPSQSGNPFGDAEGQAFYKENEDGTSEAETVLVQMNYQASGNSTSGLDIRI